LLNLLYKYIPQKYRYLANAQLEDLQTKNGKGSAMSSYRELIEEYENFLRHINWRDTNQRSEAWLRGCIGKQKLLPWFGLRVFCNEIVWHPIVDFNNLSAPAVTPMVYAFGRKVELSSIIANFGASLGIVHDTTGCGCSNRIDWPGHEVRDDCFVIRHFVKVKTMQLDAFIRHQKMLDGKYREEQKNSAQMTL